MSGTWADYESQIGGVEKLLADDKYEVEVVSANPMFRDGVTGRAIFIEFAVQSGIEAGAFATTYVFVPEPGNRKAGNWYVQKMKGFGDLKPVYAMMPEDDLQAALNILCAAIIGKRVWAQIGPGNGEFSNKNSLFETWPIDEADTSAVTPPTPEQVQAVQDSYTKRDDQEVSEVSAPAPASAPEPVSEAVAEAPTENTPEETEVAPEPTF